ncbi:putative DNA helicase ino80 [Geranomyces variabilis]|nr:putative DNA helicase ino80 [Geranomyces variabilis]
MDRGPPSALGKEGLHPEPLRFVDRTLSWDDLRASAIELENRNRQKRQLLEERLREQELEDLELAQQMKDPRFAYDSPYSVAAYARRRESGGSHAHSDYNQRENHRLQSTEDPRVEAELYERHRRHSLLYSPSTGSATANAARDNPPHTEAPRYHHSRLTDNDRSWDSDVSRIPPFEKLRLGDAWSYDRPASGGKSAAGSSFDGNDHMSISLLVNAPLNVHARQPSIEVSARARPTSSPDTPSALTPLAPPSWAPFPMHSKHGLFHMRGLHDTGSSPYGDVDAARATHSESRHEEVAANGSHMDTPRAGAYHDNPDWENSSRPSSAGNSKKAEKLAAESETPVGKGKRGKARTRAPPCKSTIALPSDTPVAPSGLPEDFPLLPLHPRTAVSSSLAKEIFPRALSPPRAARHAPQQQVNDEEEIESSDPDDLDVPENMSAEAKANLVSYMVHLHARKRKVIARYERSRARKLARFEKELTDKYGEKLDRIQDTPRRKRKRSRERSASTKKSRWEENSVQDDAEPGSSDEVPAAEDPDRLLREQEEARDHLWRTIAKRDIPLARALMDKYVITKRTNVLKIAQLASTVMKRSRLSKTQATKELISRTKRAAREMLMFWKKNEREERELRKRAEKEKMELRKREEESREAQRQARKLNFLITQTELYSHFVGKKLHGDKSDKMEEDTIALGATESVAFADIDFDAEDDLQLKARAAHEAQSALAKQLATARAFDAAAAQSVQKAVEGGSSSSNIQISEGTVDQMDFLNPSSLNTETEVEQPRMLTVTLKSYQLKGLTWLAGLWEQGINGILADEMGLGKTIQSISLMAHLAETHNIWGPFLVVSPASTLPNWQQEIARFTPHLKVLPYWGDPDDRKTLRGFLNPKKLGMRDAPFHVAITSYQLIVTDAQYFSRIKWQYMILDEAQAIKSSSSQRWKTLLKLPSRNRLLLTGTPIQNSMQELWSLLHFIMPTLFDSHEEFSEWFSKDIESHVEAGGEGKGLNEEQLRRLHMILKPFMLRRVKRDVENELADKIETELPCTLTWRQRELYRRLKSKVSVRELLDGVGSSSASNVAPTNPAAPITENWGDDDGGNDTLMNLVMQFRKVCNHPELFERGYVKGPLLALSPQLMATYAGPLKQLSCSDWSMLQFVIPKLIWNEAATPPWRWRGARILTADWIAEEQQRTSGSFGFLPFISATPGELARLSDSDLFARWVAHLLVRDQLSKLRAYYARNAVPSGPQDLMLHITALDAGSDNDTRVHTALQHVAADAQAVSILTRVETAYSPAAIACPVMATASSRSFISALHSALYDLRIMRLLAAPGPRPDLENGEYGSDDDISWLNFTPITRADYDTRQLVDVVHPGSSLLGEPARPRAGWSFLVVPSVEKLVTDSGKMLVLDKLLRELKKGGHRVLIFFQMTLMMDLMEEYMSSRQYQYLRLDGSTSIYDRRDLVNDWQTRPELFVFLLSTRAGGLGINLTAADTVIFFDSDWNPTCDQQAMDRSHRLGQTKQVMVYRLITVGTIEERILMRARQKDQIQKVVISGGEFKQQVEFKPKEVLSLLLDDDEMQEKVRKETALRVQEEQEKERAKAAKAQEKQQQKKPTASNAKPPRAPAASRTRSSNKSSPAATPAPEALPQESAGAPPIDPTAVAAVGAATPSPLQQQVPAAASKRKRAPAKLKTPAATDGSKPAPARRKKAAVVAANATPGSQLVSQASSRDATPASQADSARGPD